MVASWVDGKDAHWVVNSVWYSAVSKETRMVAWLGCSKVAKTDASMADWLATGMVVCWVDEKDGHSVALKVECWVALKGIPMVEHWDGVMAGLRDVQMVDLWAESSADG